MKKLLVTGSAGLAGSASVRRFAGRGWRVHGLDNDLRAYFFGPAASTRTALEELVRNVPSYVHHAVDHVWRNSDRSKFRAQYPAWAPTKRVPDILAEILAHNRGGWWNREAGDAA